MMIHSCKRTNEQNQLHTLYRLIIYYTLRVCATDYMHVCVVCALNWLHMAWVSKWEKWIPPQQQQSSGCKPFAIVEMYIDVFMLPCSLLNQWRCRCPTVRLDMQSVDGVHTQRLDNAKLWLLDRKTILTAFGIECEWFINGPMVDGLWMEKKKHQQQSWNRMFQY